MHSLLSAVLLALVISLPFSAKSQTSGFWKHYSISKSIDTVNLNAKKLFRDSKKASSLQYNLAEFYLYKNGVPVKPSGKVKTDFFPAACLCFKFEDTLMFNSGLGRQAGVGVGIKIFNGMFSGTLHANSKNALIYKVHKRDSAYINDLSVEAETQSLKLIRPLSQSPNEIIIGEYRATYRRFYEKRHHSSDGVARYTVKIIFKTKVTTMESLRELVPADNK
jgi:hypothetical protein